MEHILSDERRKMKVPATAGRDSLSLLSLPDGSTGKFLLRKQRERPQSGKYPREEEENLL